MNRQNKHQYASSFSQDAPCPVMLCLLGNFRLLVSGDLVPTRAGGKSEVLLSLLAFHSGRRMPREQLLQSLWPESGMALARNSLHNLVHHVNRLLGMALCGAACVLQEDGYYRLNLAAGIGVDVINFDRFVEDGDQQLHFGNAEVAMLSYDLAAQLYRGDMQVAADVQAVMERERLRARYLTLLAQLAEYNYQQGAYSVALAYLWRLLEHDAYREDAHRLVMRCYVRRGERAAALHHYQVCMDVLRTEFDAVPETATLILFEQIRLAPDQI
ncbi:MAG TPA: BTAD domain-containing putative transcriptional regulator [Gammaproteobacteria bacterium]|nr:BTAD domain-containing putative transcriptional regulator [Gammaproteobacteria bacterium]